MFNQKRSKIKFNPNQITELKIICENGVILNITPTNISKLIVFYPCVHQDNIQICHYSHKEMCTDVFLQETEMILKLHKQANTIYHAYDNPTCKKRVFDRLAQKDITQLEVSYYEEQSQYPIHYLLSLVQSQGKWYQSNQYQNNTIAKDGSLTVEVRLNEE